MPWAGKPGTLQLSPCFVFPTSHYHVGQNQWPGLTDGLLLILAFIQLHWAALLFMLQNNLTDRFQQISGWRKSVADMTWSSTFHVRERKTVRVGVILNAHHCNEELYALLTVNIHWFNQIANRETAINEKWKYGFIALPNSCLGSHWCVQNIEDVKLCL